MTTLPPLYPTARLRRNRRFEWLRDLVAETSLSHKDLVWPLFVREKDAAPTVASMPGVRRYTLEELDEALTRARALGIRTVLLFPVIPPELRDEVGSESLKDSALVFKALARIKALAPDMGLMADLALDPYTSHGHDGLIKDGDVHNDSTTEVLAKVALMQAQAGADIIAPSDMMDGRVAAIRHLLDHNGHDQVGICSYAAKYCSALYGPFREILDSQGFLKGGHKKSYQMDPRNGAEAIREVAQDLHEGADSVIVKPGTLYLDIIHRVKETFQVPTFAYHVSGEYAMLKAAAATGFLDEKRTLLETLICFKRAGADAIITYSALEAAQWLNEV
ncbi:MAG: porphobilinogen synthase [Alphaproteobacteria bacterium]|jgi:porphobilinogen synthase|nr:porphobilinogen synthase [Alphaproteobacteria bacterium]